MTELLPGVRRRLLALVTAASVLVGPAVSVGLPAGPASGAVAETPPGAPAGHVAVYDAASDRITTSWRPPSDDGGLAVTAYDLFFNGGFVRSVSPPITSVTIGASAGSLPLGPHDVGVRAVNAIGAGTTSTVTVLVTRAPGAPTGVTASAGNGQASVQWSAASANGAPVTGYRVTVTPGGASVSVTGAATSAVVPGLSNGTSYTFRVVATSSAGESTPSTASNAVTPLAAPAPPDAPTAVLARAGDGSASVSWSPAAANGSPVTGYRVTVSPGGTQVTAGSGATNVVVRGLVNGTAYAFTVVATSAAGESRASAVSNTVVPQAPTPPPPPPNPPPPTPPTPPSPPTPSPPGPDPSGPSAPDAPTGVLAVALDASARVSWTAAEPHGSPVSAYRVTASPGGATTTLPGDATEAVVPGLTNGTAYAFTVVAVSAAGDSEPSATSNTVTPVGLELVTIPDAPTEVTATAGDGRATVTWLLGSANGADLTGQVVTASPGGASVAVDGDATEAVVTGLDNGTAYTFEVVATNAVGSSPPSRASRPVTPAGPPGRPGRPGLVVRGRSIVVSWDAASVDGAAVTGYRVVTRGLARSTDGARRVTLRGLAPGRYVVRVVALSQAGSSPASVATRARVRR
jgi:titin